jgi:hypothetical protein
MRASHASWRHGSALGLKRYGSACGRMGSQSEVGKFKLTNHRRWVRLAPLYFLEYFYDVRLLAIFLIALLLPLSVSAPSIAACSMTACCGANCSSIAPVSQLNCCEAPTAPDRATDQAQAAQHFDSVGSMPAVTIAISHLRNIVVHGYSPPDRLASLALLCSRQI